MSRLRAPVEHLTMAVCRRARAVAAGLFAARLLAVGYGIAAAQSGSFPSPERPVAPIISSAYSTEETRDSHGEGDRVMSRLGVASGLRVADIGAGDGYYTVRLARRLGAGAMIYAQDVERRHLDRLSARLTREGITGVTLVHGGVADPRLPQNSVDLAILAHVYHEIAQPYEFLYHLHGALTPRGRVAIVDNDKPTAQHGTPPALLRCEMAAVGYREADFAWLAPADGYLAVFVAAGTPPAPGSIRPCRVDRP
jgi:SAM-dependent methyltransferase